MWQGKMNKKIRISIILSFLIVFCMYGSSSAETLAPDRSAQVLDLLALECQKITDFSFMAQNGDLSQFEHGTNWGLHTAASDSKFKVLDVFTINEKTQILLLHLEDNLEDFFVDNATIDGECVAWARKIFVESFEKEIIEEVNTPEWLERCSFPIGMDNDGNIWDLDD